MVWARERAKNDYNRLHYENLTHASQAAKKLTGKINSLFSDNKKDEKSTTINVLSQHNKVIGGIHYGSFSQQPQPQQQQQQPSPSQADLHSGQYKCGHKRHTEEDESRPSSAKKQSAARDAPVASGPSSADPVHVADGLTSVDLDEEEMDNVATMNIIETPAAFLCTSDLNKIHKYRLESHGIFQIGQCIPRQSDVPAALYDSLVLENEPPRLSNTQFSPYLQSTLFNNIYGTSAMRSAYSTPVLLPQLFFRQRIWLESTLPKSIISRVSFLFWKSENIHCRDHTPKLADSEVSYCHYALGPLIDLCCGVISNLQCDFKVGETILSATKQLPPPSPTYLADGTVFVKDSGLELLLFEASGKFGTRDRRRHTKGAYDCYAMIHPILSKYPYADKELMNDLRVLFLHSSGKDDCLRLWVMKPCYDGEIITFERMDRVTITTNHNDKREAIQLITFFWKVKGMLELSLNAFNNLKASSDTNFLLLQDSSELNQPPLLPSFLKAEPLKPVDNQDYVGTINLDPVSSLF